MPELYTNTPRSDGFGAQCREIFFSIVWTLVELKGEFVYTPISRMEHNYKNDKNWINDTNNFLNITSQFNKSPNGNVKKSRYDKNKMTRIRKPSVLTRSENANRQNLEPRQEPSKLQKLKQNPRSQEQMQPNSSSWR